jgi:hypothetical protein
MYGGLGMHIHSNIINDELQEYAADQFEFRLQQKLYQGKIDDLATSRTQMGKKQDKRHKSVSSNHHKNCIYSLNFLS